jgi:flagellar biosynthesis protein FlhF
MKVRRFYAKDMSQALKQISNELGAEAAILSSKKTPTGVEVVAALDYDENILHNQVQQGLSRPVSEDKVAIKSTSQTASRLENRQRILAEKLNVPFQPHPQLKPTNPSTRYQNTQIHQSQRVQSNPGVTAHLNDNRQQQSQLSSSPNSSNNASANAYGGSSTRGPSKRDSSARGPAINGKRIASEIKQELDRVTQSNAVSQAEELKTLFEAPTQAETEWGEDPSLTSLKDEVALLRNMLQNQMEGLAWQNKTLKSPVQSAIMEKLLQVGFSPSLTKEVSDKVSFHSDVGKAWTNALSIINDSIQTPDYEPILDGGIYAVVGPTGVGKTTTVAKLAARYALKFGADSVGLITTDNYRIAAHEQLKIYGRIIGCAVAVVHSSDELQEKIIELSNKKLILIDTAGMSQRDQRLVDQIDRFNQVDASINKLLVLSATSNRFTLDETLQVFSRYNLAGCIVTKMDEAVSLGEVLSLIAQKGLLLSYMTNGQRVPEDICLGSGNKILKQAIQISQHAASDSDEWWTAKQFGNMTA